MQANTAFATMSPGPQSRERSDRDGSVIGTPEQYVPVATLAVLPPAMSRHGTAGGAARRLSKNRSGPIANRPQVTNLPHRARIGY